MALPQDAFVRRLPGSLAIERRVEIDGLVTASDLCFEAYDQLRAILVAVNEERRQVENIELRKLALNVWAIVDNVDSLRGYARRFSPGPDTCMGQLIQNTDVSRRLRNKMDHRTSNVSNFASTSGAMEPIHGCLTYLRPITGGEEGRVVYHTVFLGQLHHDEHVGIAIHTNVLPHASEPQFLTLQAFGEEFDISSTMRELDEAMAECNERMERSIRSGAASGASEVGCPVEELLVPKFII